MKLGCTLKTRRFTGDRNISNPASLFQSYSVGRYRRRPVFSPNKGLTSDFLAHRVQLIRYPRCVPCWRAGSTQERRTGVTSNISKRPKHFQTRRLAFYCFLQISFKMPLDACAVSACCAGQIDLCCGGGKMDRSCSQSKSEGQRLLPTDGS